MSQVEPGNGAPVDIRLETVRAVQALRQPVSGSGRSSGRGVTSDLTVDETLLLHSIGWEPVDLVNGVSLYSVPIGVWQWTQGEVVSASDAHARAVAMAAKRMHGECTKAGGHGVVGVHAELTVHPHHIDAELVGTAVRPIASESGTASSKARASKVGPSDGVFISDLSARDFVLLNYAGWIPVGLAFGTSFVNAPRRSAATAFQQKSQNVELTNFTEAMYSARESAMERMQASALRMGGTGVVAVTVTEGPMGFARHVVQFSAWGTAVRLDAAAHRHLQPNVILSMDDSVVGFGAEALRGR